MNKLILACVVLFLFYFAFYFYIMTDLDKKEPFTLKSFCLFNLLYSILFFCIGIFIGKLFLGA